MSNADGAAKVLYTCELDVRWGDMDSMGHVNNTLYFRFCEQARMQWFTSLDLSQTEAPDSLIVIINAFCEFQVPVVYPARLQIEMSADGLGKSSFMSHYTIKDAPGSYSTPDPVHYATGRAKIVWVDHTGAKSIPVPNAIRQLITDT